MTPMFFRPAVVQAEVVGVPALEQPPKWAIARGNSALTQTLVRHKVMRTCSIM
jgi:hypothetical protein